MDTKTYVEQEKWQDEIYSIISMEISEEEVIWQICKLADTYYDQEEWTIASKILLKAFEYPNIYIEVIFRLGLIYERLGNYQEAIYWYESIVKGDKRSYKIKAEEELFWEFRPLIQLSVCYYQIGDMNKSYHYNERAKDIYPDNEFVKQNIVYFKSIGLGNEEIDIKNIQEIKKLLQESNPQTVLEISSEREGYGRLIRQTLMGDDSFRLRRLDKIHLTNKEAQVEAALYHHIYEEEILERIVDLPQYDMIIIPYMIRDLEDDHIRLLINKLLPHVNQSILIIEPLIKDSVRRFHPTYFRDYDFSYAKSIYEEEVIQFYNIFPNHKQPVEAIQYPAGNKDEKQKLKIGYIIPNGGLTGGTKCLLEQARQLQHKGHQVYFYKYGDKTEAAMPAWCDLVEKRDFEQAIVLETYEKLEDYTQDMDVIVVGWMLLLPYTININKPIILWEQGSCEIYGDYTGLIAHNNSYKKQLEAVYRLPGYLFSVAPIVAHILSKKYGRSSYILTTGIDTEFYKPLKNKTHGKTILLVGNPYLSFKGFDLAIKILEKLWEKRQDFNVKWVCQGQPNIKDLSFPIEYRVAPPQDVLVRYYQEADLFMSTSLYESFPMPPMEAMACGLPVVATDCGGVMSYARPLENCFIVDQEDVEKFVGHLEYLLDNVEARIEMGEKGRQTAMQYTYSKIVEQAESYILDVFNKSI